MKHCFCLLLIIIIGFAACSDDPIIDPPDTDPMDTTTTPIDTIPELTTTPADWMSQVIEYYDDQDVSINDICYPRSHDTGTYTETLCTIGGNACNTQTQHLNMLEQLEAGARAFDIRPVLAEDGLYYTYHATGCGGLGCNGDLVENILNDVRTFLDNHAELVFLELGHFCHTGSDDAVFVEMVNSILGERLYKESAIEFFPFLEKPLRLMVDLEAGTGKAVVMYADLDEFTASEGAGMFPHSVKPTEGGWSNVYIFHQLKTDQFNRWEAYSNSGESLFEFSWTLTQNDSLAVQCAIGNETASILNLATEANSHLSASMDELISSGSIQKGRIPNVLSIDFVDTFVTEECVKLTKLNLE